MNVKKWLKNNTKSLEGRTIAVTGSTGGIGRELCRYLLSLNASLILIDRSKEKSDELCKILTWEFKEPKIEQMFADMENIESVRIVCDALKKYPLDALILNAGAYSIPRHKCSTGYDNVFQINFVSPYFMVRKLLPCLRERGGTVVAVGSIAHNYSKTDAKDIDFSTRKRASLVYGNAKRYVMYALQGLFQNETEVKLAVTHPGITFTGITAHYPKLIFAVIKHPMKVIFMKPRTACLSILYGLFKKCEKGSWIGPAVFDVWGKPQKKHLRTASEKEQNHICIEAERIFKEIK